MPGAPQKCKLGHETRIGENMAIYWSRGRMTVKLLKLNPRREASFVTDCYR
jgi:hypothetical protein